MSDKSSGAKARGVPVVDMGIIDGVRVYYTHNRSIRELMEDGEVVALPDEVYGAAFKLKMKCSPLELMAQLTIEEADARIAACKRLIGAMEAREVGGDT